jgi:adenylyltransferase/sulfurtransferase
MPDYQYRGRGPGQRGAELLTGNENDLHGSLMQFDVWRNQWRSISVGEPAENCPACALGKFESLQPESAEFAAVLCGRHAVQVSPARPMRVDLNELSERLARAGEVKGKRLPAALSHRRI